MQRSEARSSKITVYNKILSYRKEERKGKERKERKGKERKGKKGKETKERR
jgi:hypothetical protein